MPPPIAGALRRGRSPLHRGATPRAGADRGRDFGWPVGRDAHPRESRTRGYRCRFVLWLIVRSNRTIFFSTVQLARYNIIVGLDWYGPICRPFLGLKSSPRAGLVRSI